MSVYDRIKKQAGKRGWSLQELAEKAGLGTNSIYRWREMNPKMDKLTAVADVLQVSVDYLLGNTDNPSPTNKSTVDLSEDVPMTFEGRPVSAETLEIFRAILRAQDSDNK